MPRYNSEPAAEFYVPDEDLVLEEVMDRVLVRYGKDPVRLQRLLSTLYACYPVAFRRVVNGRLGRHVL